jgi:hypothetical protein
VCGYPIKFYEGIGMMYSPHAVFYGRCDDPTQNWSIALPDGYCKNDKPLLLSLVKSKRVRDKAFELLAKGAKPSGYGHYMYHCSKCMQFTEKFDFKLVSETETFKPEHRCSKCNTPLCHVRPEVFEDHCSEGNVGFRFLHKNGSEAKWKCPECGGGRLVTESWGDWD